MGSMEEIYLEHGEMTYGLLLTRTQDLDLMGELTQETFYQAVKNIGIYKRESDVPTRLCDIARDLWCEHLRKQKKYVPLEEAAEIFVDSAEKQMFHSQDSVQILRLVYGPENFVREVMYLRPVGNLISGQIGEIMEKSENWARTACYRGKGRIMKEAEKL